ncbi:hypothetical protein AAHE18_17G222200 [Arachis hypogaea]
MNKEMIFIFFMSFTQSISSLTLSYNIQPCYPFSYVQSSQNRKPIHHFHLWGIAPLHILSKKCLDSAKPRIFSSTTFIIDLIVKLPSVLDVHTTLSSVPAFKKIFCKQECNSLQCLRSHSKTLLLHRRFQFHKRPSQKPQLQSHHSCDSI